MSLSLLDKLKVAFKSTTPEQWRFDDEFDVEDNGHAVIKDVQDVMIARIYQWPHDTWLAKDNAEFIVLAQNAMPDLLEAVELLANYAPDLEVVKRLTGSVKDVKQVAVTWEGEDGNSGYIHGIEHINNDEVLHVEWFRSEVMRDLALQKYQQDCNAVISEAWQHIGNSLTRVFNDEMNSCSWFVLDGTLMTAPMAVDNSDIYTGEITDPEFLPDWYHNFITNLLSDDDYQLHYKDGVFVDVLTDWLKIENEYVQVFQKTGVGVNSEVTLTEEGFIFQGVEITNPTLSSCGRFQVDPKKAYGFSVYHTGGGCTALQLETTDGDYIWLTDTEGTSHELPTEPGAPFMMGIYDAEGNEIANFTLKTGIPTDNF